MGQLSRAEVHLARVRLRIHRCNLPHSMLPRTQARQQRGRYVLPVDILLRNHGLRNGGELHQELATRPTVSNGRWGGVCDRKHGRSPIRSADWSKHGLGGFGSSEHAFRLGQRSVWHSRSDRQSAVQQLDGLPWSCTLLVCTGHVFVCEKRGRQCETLVRRAAKRPAVGLRRKQATVEEEHSGRWRSNNLRRLPVWKKRVFRQVAMEACAWLWPCHLCWDKLRRVIQSNRSLDAHWSAKGERHGQDSRPWLRVLVLLWSLCRIDPFLCRLHHRWSCAGLFSNLPQGNSSWFCVRSDVVGRHCVVVHCQWPSQPSHRIPPLDNRALDNGLSSWNLPLQGDQRTAKHRLLSSHVSVHVCRSNTVGIVESFRHLVPPGRRHRAIKVTHQLLVPKWAKSVKAFEEEKKGKKKSGWNESWRHFSLHHHSTDKSISVLQYVGLQLYKFQDSFKKKILYYRLHVYSRETITKHFSRRISRISSDWYIYMSILMHTLILKFIIYLKRYLFHLAPYLKQYALFPGHFIQIESEPTEICFLLNKYLFKRYFITASKASSRIPFVFNF